MNITRTEYLTELKKLDNKFGHVFIDNVGELRRFLPHMTEQQVEEVFNAKEKVYLCAPAVILLAGVQTLIFEPRLGGNPGGHLSIQKMMLREFVRENRMRYRSKEEYWAAAQYSIDNWFKDLVVRIEDKYKSFEKIVIVDEDDFNKQGGLEVGLPHTIEAYVGVTHDGATECFMSDVEAEEIVPMYEIYKQTLAGVLVCSRCFGFLDKNDSCSCTGRHTFVPSMRLAPPPELVVPDSIKATVKQILKDIEEYVEYLEE